MMHPSTKILITLGATMVVAYAGWRIVDYREAKRFQERRIKAQQRRASES